MDHTEQRQYIEMAYARVSSRSQNLERQETAIFEAVPDLKAKYFFEDKHTGKEFDRPEYTKLKEKIEELKEANADTQIRLTVHELDRIGRDYREIQNEVYWFRNHGVTLRFLDIPEELFNTSMGITGELLTDIVLLLKSYWAEQELHYKEKRTREGIAEAQAKGVRFGREAIKCQTAHCGRCKLHFDFGRNTSPIVPYRHLPQTLRGLTADCRSLV